MRSVHSPVAGRLPGPPEDYLKSHNMYETAQERPDLYPFGRDMLDYSEVEPLYLSSIFRGTAPYLEYACAIAVFASYALATLIHITHRSQGHTY